MFAVKLSIFSDHEKCISPLFKSSLRIRIRCFLTSGFGMEKTLDPDTLVELQILKFFVADPDPGSGAF
jgi:hypothetical protein